jgi:hypothetical protein
MKYEVYLAYSNSHTILSPIIRAIEDSEYSHIAIFITPGEPTDDSMLIESTISRNGVNISTLRAFKERSSGWKITRLHFQIDDFDKLRYFALLEEGKKYDLTGVIGLGFKRDWQENDRWWCTELVAYILLSLGFKVTESNNVHKIGTKNCQDWPQTTIDKSFNGDKQ